MTVKTTDVVAFSANLNVLLREVEQGDILFVTEDGRLIAEVRPPASADGSAFAADLRYRHLVDRGILQPAIAPSSREWALAPGLNLPSGTVEALLAAERDG